MKVLITGGAGYIGTELTSELVQHKDIREIIIYDNFSRANHGLFMQGKLDPKNKIRIIEGDILDSQKLKMVVKEVDMVVHLAAKVTTPYVSENHHGYDQVNHWGTAEVVYAVEDSPNVKKFIHLSSTSVYGFSDSPVNETTKERPQMAYSISKFRAESHVKRLFEGKGLQTCIFRSGNVFGFSPSMRFESVINRFAFNAKYLKKIIVYGQGDQIRPFIEIGDIIKVIKFSLFNEMDSKIYNVFDHNIKILDIAILLKKLYPELEIQYLNQHVTYGSLVLEKNIFIERIFQQQSNYEEKIVNLINVLL